MSIVVERDMPSMVSIEQSRKGSAQLPFTVEEYRAPKSFEG